MTGGPDAEALGALAVRAGPTPPSSQPAWARRLGALLGRPWLPWAFVGFGLLLRLVRYLSHFALEVSEAQLALEVLPRTLGQAFSPLGLDQAAPPGFVAILILSKDLFGPGELALRSFPFAASLATLPLFVWLARRLLQPAGVTIATGLFAVAPLLIFYGSLVKQYVPDVLFTITILLLALRVLERRRGALPLYAAVGAASLWFSHPAAFVVAGTGLVLGVGALARRDWDGLMRLVPVGLVLAASFAGFVRVIDRGTTQNEFLLSYWSAGFLPFPPRSLSDLRWLVDRSIGVLRDPGAFWPPGAAAFALLAGVIYAWRQRRDATLMLLSPLPLLLVASALKLYPVEGRLVLFLVPILILFIASGADGLLVESGRTALVGVALCFLLFFDPVASEAKKLVSPPRFEDTRPLLEHLRHAAEPDDTLYVYWDAQYAFRYYAPSYGLDPARAVVGTSAESRWAEDVADIEQLRGRPRVWFLFSHVHRRGSPGTEEDFFVFELDRVGRRLDERHAPGASLYLYDLRG